MIALLEKWNEALFEGCFCSLCEIEWRTRPASFEFEWIQKKKLQYMFVKIKQSFHFM